MAELFAILSGLIVLIGAPFYAVDIFNGKTKPQRTTWFIWSALGVIAFYSQFKLGAHWSLVFAGIDGLGSLAVFGLSLRYGVGGWTRLDKLALAIATTGLVISLWAHAPLVAIIGIILADAAGAMLTIRKSYVSPESETAITWFFVGTSSLFAIFSIGHITIGLLLYPLYLTIGNYAVLVAIGLGKLVGKRPSKVKSIS